MTISVCISVNDGLVLASDSATTMQLDHGDKQVYNHADKIFNLFKGLPIGAATWGLGSIGHASMATLCKDFRKQLADASAGDLDSIVEPWGICIHSYTVEDVANKFRTFLLENLNPILEEVEQENERRREAAEEEGALEEIQPFRLDSFSFRVGGYSAPPGSLAEIFELHFDGQTIHGPTANDKQISWGGQPDAIQRLVLGVDGGTVRAISQTLECEQDDALEIAKEFLPYTERHLVFSAMPIIDAIDFARFLVNTSIQYYRFLPGAQIVGGPVEIATITRHEGFKWIERKHFFDAALNPPVN